MARVLRPGSGRAVLLVTQPYLLGLLGVNRERHKKKFSRRQAGKQGLQERAPRQGASSFMGRRDGAEFLQGQAEDSGEQIEVTGKVLSACENQTSKSCDSAAAGLASNSVGGQDGSATPGELWRVRAQHAVNVGGLMSWLLVLDRTPEPAPRRSLDRRKRWVGYGAHVSTRCNSQGNKGGAQADSTIN